MTAAAVTTAITSAVLLVSTMIATIVNIYCCYRLFELLLLGDLQSCGCASRVPAQSHGAVECGTRALEFPFLWAETSAVEELRPSASKYVLYQNREVLNTGRNPQIRCFVNILQIASSEAPIPTWPMELKASVLG